MIKEADNSENNNEQVNEQANKQEMREGTSKERTRKSLTLHYPKENIDRSGFKGCCSCCRSFSYIHW